MPAVDAFSLFRCKGRNPLAETHRLSHSESKGEGHGSKDTTSLDPKNIKHSWHFFKHKNKSLS